MSLCQCSRLRWNPQCFSQDNGGIIRRSNRSSHAGMLAAGLLPQALPQSQNNSPAQSRKRLLHQPSSLETDNNGGRQKGLSGGCWESGSQGVQLLSSMPL